MMILISDLPLKIFTRNSLTFQVGRVAPQPCRNNAKWFSRIKRSKVKPNNSCKIMQVVPKLSTPK
jgi:hypothetical protein